MCVYVCVTCCSVIFLDGCCSCTCVMETVPRRVFVIFLCMYIAFASFGSNLTLSENKTRITKSSGGGWNAGATGATTVLIRVLTVSVNVLRRLLLYVYVVYVTGEQTDVRLLRRNRVCAVFHQSHCIAVW